MLFLASKFPFLSLSDSSFAWSSTLYFMQPICTAGKAATKVPIALAICRIVSSCFAAKSVHNVSMFVANILR